MAIQRVGDTKLRGDGISAGSQALTLALHAALSLPRQPKVALLCAVRADLRPPPALSCTESPLAVLLQH